MDFQPPKDGQIINYWYLWKREADQGQDAGIKDRPCAIILAHAKGRVIVAPITHSQPEAGTQAIELPPALKKQAGLDHERSWIITSEVNHFAWPGFDIEPIRNRTDKSYVYGQLPPNFLKQVKITLSRNARTRSLRRVDRDEPEGD